MGCDTANLISLTGNAAITRGASHAFGLILNQIVAPATTQTPVWPLTNCSLSAVIYRDEACRGELVSYEVAMPVSQGDPVLCSLTPESTAALPHTPEGEFFWVKVLFTRADGTVEPRGFGPVEIIG